MCVFADEDEEGESHSVALTPLSSFYTHDALKRQKKKNRKMKEGKVSKVKKRKKEVSWSSLVTASAQGSIRRTSAWNQQKTEGEKV